MYLSLSPIGTNNSLKRQVLFIPTVLLECTYLQNADSFVLGNRFFVGMNNHYLEEFDKALVRPDVLL